MTQVARQRYRFVFHPAPRVVVAGMLLGLGLFYWGGAWSPHGIPALLGLLVFGLCALLRPDLGLLFVVGTVPLYLIPASLPALRANGFALPLHEATLFAVVGATIARGIWRRVTQPQATHTSLTLPTLLKFYAPYGLFLIAGILGVVLAVARGPALIEFRRLIIEPLLFYVLVKVLNKRSAPLQGGLAPFSRFHMQLLNVFVLSGTLVALFGLLQYIGLDLVPLLGHKDCFCENIVVDAGARRVASVYGHPNNLGLFLGRVWPLAAALALSMVAMQRVANTRYIATISNQAWLYALGALICLGGIVVSFSRGAWLGTLAAFAVVALPTLRIRFGKRFALALVACGIVLAVLGGFVLTLRGDIASGSTPVRLLLWREALGYIRLYPQGIGLDQFGTYHAPQSGLSLIDPALIGSSEEFAAHPHNLLLDIWLRLGPLGMLAFVWLLVRFLRSSRRSATHPFVLGSLAAMVAALVHGLVDNFYFVPDLALAFWFLILLMDVNRQPEPAE